MFVDVDFAFSVVIILGKIAVADKICSGSRFDMEECRTASLLS